MYKLINKIGALLVVSGFVIFLSLYVLTPFIVTKKTIETAIENEGHASLIESRLSGILNVPTTNLELQRELTGAFELINNEAEENFGLKKIEVEQLVEIATSEGLTESNVAEVIHGEHRKEKVELFSNYGNWLFNEVLSDEKARSEIPKIADNMLKYEVIPQFGMDRYQQKSTRYRIAKNSVAGPVVSENIWALLLTFGLIIAGGLLMSLSLMLHLPGSYNNRTFSHPAKSRKWLGIIIGTFLIGFYIILYYFPHYITPWVALVDPISYWLKGAAASEFFLYGLLYTLAVLVMGVRMLIKYRDNNYQLVRTMSVMFFQLAFAFLIPEILVRLNQPYFDFKNIWPLDYDFFFDYELANLIQAGNLGVFMLIWGIALIVLGVPLFTFFYGKRWYCSWVCGCGGLAETLGDPFRQLSDKSLKAWKIERYMVHGVLVLAVFMTAAVLYTYFTGNSQFLGLNSYGIREVYGSFIGAAFAGVIGTGFYPLMGNRVWCRFGCPLAAYLGIIQRFRSRFRITTNGGQCISCGNCSTYCEMGIDVRSYAQKGQNIVRASCVGCGICASVCPRGVLKLENSNPGARTELNGFIK